MSQPYVGEIRFVGFEFAPKGWALCNGQLLSINQWQALFSILRTTYGGDGLTTFALPDLRGRVPLHMGQGARLTSRKLGEQIGEEGHVLTVSEMPAHGHVPLCNSKTGDNVQGPAGTFWAVDSANVFQGYAPTPDALMSDGDVGVSGQGIPHTNLQPYLVLNAIIALTGTFPPRS